MIDRHPLVAGLALSFAAAVAWAFAVVLFKRSGETFAPFTLNFFRVGTSCVLFGATLLVLNYLPLDPADGRGAPEIDDPILGGSPGPLGAASLACAFHQHLDQGHVVHDRGPGSDVEDAVVGAGERLVGAPDAHHRHPGAAPAAGRC